MPKPPSPHNTPSKENSSIAPSNQASPQHYSPPLIDPYVDVVLQLCLYYNFYSKYGTNALSKFSPDTELVLYPLQDKLTLGDKSLDLSAFKLSRLFFSLLSSGSSSCWRSYRAQLRLSILKDKLTSGDKSLDLSAFKLSRLFFSLLSSGSSSCWRLYGAQ
ncbi:hypothetical protein Tco_0630258 [Tanacetum coccineum]